MQPQYISTAKLAEQLDRRPASIITALWRNGHFYGIKPVKLPGDKKGARLLWPADAVARIATGKVA
jgi:hypothetical protein